MSSIVFTFDFFVNKLKLIILILVVFWGVNMTSSSRENCNYYCYSPFIIATFKLSEVIKVIYSRAVSNCIQINITDSGH